MKKLIVLLLLCILILPSCVNENDIILENESLKDIEIESPTDCKFVKGIRPENRYDTSDMEFIETRGYEPCSTCIK